jgi:hypothetical protein
MSVEKGSVPPDRSEPWQVIRVGRRVRWESGPKACEGCGSDVRLDRRHHYVAMSQGTDQDRPSTTDERVVFCTEACLEQWEEEA